VSTRTPPLHVSEIGGRVRLSLGELGYADGATLPEAADELVRRLLVIAMAFRTSGIGRMYSECRPDPALLEFIWELGDIAARGGDIRERLFSAEGAP
jgi:hypothetical protein